MVQTSEHIYFSIQIDYMGYFTLYLNKIQQNSAYRVNRMNMNFVGEIGYIIKVMAELLCDSHRAPCRKKSVN